MIREVILPKLGETMEEGTIVEWFKNEGDRVRRGDTLFSAESDKAILEVEAAGQGFLRKILVPAGEKVPVLTVVGLITSTADEALEGYAHGQADKREPAVPSVETSAGAVKPQAVGVASAPSSRTFASPRARRTARERGVDLSQVRGTGPNGRISERDVLIHLQTKPKATPTAVKAAATLGVDIAAVTGSGVGGRVTEADVKAAFEKRAAAPAVPPPPATTPSIVPLPLTGIRGTIARRMSQSAHTTARVTITTEVDAAALVTLRQTLQAEAGELREAISYDLLMAMIAAQALREHPHMNSSLTEEGIVQHEHINVGAAVDTERGLLVPVLQDVPSRSLLDLAADLQALVSRALEGKAMPDDLSGGTFTVTNLGLFGVDAFTPIINLPECAILGIGRIATKPVVRKGEIVVGQIMVLSLTFDHRIVDGASAARFLRRVAQLVETPTLLLH